MTAGQVPPDILAELSALRRDLDLLQLEVNRTTTATDEMGSELLYQVIALEELLFARWPRSVLLRARWRRDVRASVRDIQGDDFAERRVNAIASGWITRPGSRHEGTAPA